MVFRWLRFEAANSGDATSLFTMVGAANMLTPAKRFTSAAISAGSKPPLSGTTLFAAFAKCTSPQSPEPCECDAPCTMQSASSTGSMSAK